MGRRKHHLVIEQLEDHDISASPRHRVAPSPRPRVPGSPRPRVTASPRLRVAPSTRPRVPGSPRPRVAASPRLRVAPSPRRPVAVFIGLLVALSILVPAVKAQHLPTDARATFVSSRVPLLSSTCVGLCIENGSNPRLKSRLPEPLVDRVATVGMTVSDMAASVEFYSKVLSFEKVSDVEVAGEDYEHLEGVFGLRMRVVRLRLGEEFIELKPSI